MAEIAEPTELTVTFQPNLYLQRRCWVFENMRREGVTSVLDIGCGEGELISCLCNAAPWLPPPPPFIVKNALSLPLPTATSDQERLTQIENAKEGFNYLHPTTVFGLDISRAELKYAIANTVPQAPASVNRAGVRWEPLDVKLWHGGLQSFNPEFVNIECIVSTEVIEHVTDDVLRDFAPLLLGMYHPRLLLITTPSYTFNARFTPPDAPDARRGFLDPTGRTARVFRHDDHKFEWTVQEFTDWCTQTAAEWGYTVEVDGIGRPQEKDEWGRDEQLGYASQVALFVRREGKLFEDARAARCAEVGILERSQAKQRHELAAEHKHAAHEKAKQPESLHTIGEVIKKRMEEYEEATMPVWDLWNELDINTACGGWMELLLYAVERYDGLCLEISPEVRDQWNVVRIGAIPKQVQKWQLDPEVCKGDIGSAEDINHDGNNGWGITDTWWGLNKDSETGGWGAGGSSGSDSDQDSGGWGDWKPAATIDVV